jgi:hypothetical protein
MLSNIQLILRVEHKWNYVPGKLRSLDLSNQSYLKALLFFSQMTFFPTSAPNSQLSERTAILTTKPMYRKEEPSRFDSDQSGGSWSSPMHRGREI